MRRAWITRRWPKGRIANFGEQLGPGRAARAVAIVHLAIYEAVNAIAVDHESLPGSIARRQLRSIDAAIAQAAHDTLVEMFPSQSATWRPYEG